MNKKLIALILACIALSSALAATSYLYLELNKKYTSLQSDYNELTTEHELLRSNYATLLFANQNLNDTHNTLVNDYNHLNQKYQVLIIQRNELNQSYQILTLNYTQLSSNYTQLEQTSQNLTNNYTILNNKYASLFSDFTTLSNAFNQPLTYEVTPSTSQLEQWLTTDNTNTNQYTDPDFICGDFSAMLALHAKLNHWDIGMIGVLGHTQNQARFDHAFNAILTTEGLVYIEPQTDEVWWYQSHQPMTQGTWWQYPSTGYVYIEQYIIVLTYD